MTEETVETPKKRRGWPKGKSRKPQITPEPEPPEAPIHVRLRLKNYVEEVEFGCARRTVENGFHVFFYPSKRDPYRETRREFAVSEIIEIEITEARAVYERIQAPVSIQPTQTPPVVSQGPVLHSARRAAAAALEALETSRGTVRMDTLPNISFGDSTG